MDQSQLIAQLMTTFLGELDEHVAALNRDLLALEHPPRGGGEQLLKSLFRTAHSLKGAARSVGVRAIEHGCHRLEDILEALGDGRLQLDPPLCTLLLRTADAIGDAGRRLRANQRLDDTSLGGLLSLLDGLLATMESPTLAPSTVVSSPPRPVGPAEPDEAHVPPQANASTDVHAGRQGGAPAKTVAAAAFSATGGENPGDDHHVARAVPDGSSTVRVSAKKLDSLLAQTGELLVARRRVLARTAEVGAVRDSVARWRDECGGPDRAFEKPCRERLSGMERDLDRLLAQMSQDDKLLEQAAGRLDEEVQHVRMLPFAEACQGLDRAARDLSLAHGKETELVIEGGDVELDRSILEALKDPLLHLVRNAVDHGLETRDERRAAGKPPRGRITISAMLRGTQVQVAVADDGRGLDLPALRERVRQLGLPEPPGEQELAQCVFLPRLSTARIITDVSGRGIGLDVVKNRVESLLGAVQVSSQPGRGARFTLSVPLTLTALRAIFVTAAGQTFALPASNVERLVRLSPQEVRSVEGRQMFSLEGAPVLVASLTEALGMRGHEPLASHARVPAIVLGAHAQRVAFVVDELLAEQETLVKSLGARIRAVKNVSGATLLPSGRIALILSAPGLVRTALSGRLGKALSAAPDAAQAPKKRLLVVDDSVTTRSLVKSILDAAGYDVVAAPDGEAAWRILQDQGADLVVSDVEMPRMDGFAFTEAIRKSKRFLQLPVVLVTARETPQDKARGIEVGADAYLAKSAFDQRNLLETISQLL